MMPKPVIITCAPTGGIHTPTMSPHLPITPAEIATASIEAAEAGRLDHPPCMPAIPKPANPIRDPRSISCSSCRASSNPPMR